jgi:hypothetical protein
MKTNKKTKIVLIATVVVIIAAISLFVFLFPAPQPASTTTNHPNTIQIFVDENEPSNPNNLKKIHFADLFVNTSGQLSLTILDNSVNATSLQNAIAKIQQNETLPLTIEPEQGLFQGIQVPKNDTNYIYAVSEYLRMNGFKNEVT